ncbi:MAG: diaminopimelate decarboxylase, partial [Planctomycetaceae bacterium]|nr:diaminopimelate decarboxylase [Planctomycetaceae bacterium]
MNAFQYKNNQLYCEDVAVADLAKEYGTPLWVYSENKFLKEYKELAAAFSDCDPVICYSVKANSNLSILKSLNEAGSSFDVVSGGELFRVNKAGADTSRVVFAGVGKTD